MSDFVLSEILATESGVGSSRSPQNEELEAYRQSLIELSEKQIDFIFPNDSAKHAAVVYEVFFSMAKDHVRIFCNRFSSEIFDSPQVANALSLALQRGVRVDVLTEQNPDANQSLQQLCSAPDPSRVRVFTSLRSLRSYNFSVVDDVAFRFENDKTNTKAVGNMRSPSNAKKLSNYFDTVLLKENGVHIYN